MTTTRRPTNRTVGERPAPGCRVRGRAEEQASQGIRDRVPRRVPVPVHATETQGREAQPALGPLHDVHHPRGRCDRDPRQLPGAVPRRPSPERLPVPRSGPPHRRGSSLPPPPPPPPPPPDPPPPTPTSPHPTHPPP